MKIQTNGQEVNGNQILVHREMFGMRAIFADFKNNVRELYH